MKRAASALNARCPLSLPPLLDDIIRDTILVEATVPLRFVEWGIQDRILDYGVGHASGTAGSRVIIRQGKLVQ